jgi:hypothetical protein
MTRATYSLRFHLHFACLVLPGRTAAREALAGAPATFRNWYVDARRNSIPVTLRSREAMQRQRSTLLTIRENAVQRFMTHMSRFSELDRTFRTETTTRSPAQVLSKQSPVTLAAARLTGTLAARSTTGEQPGQMHIWRLSGLRRPGLAAPGSVLPKNAPVRAATPFSSPALIWRSADQAQALQAIERSIASAAPMSMSAGSSLVAPFEQVSEPMERASRQVLDPALIDRVAEDVLGRVERRIRIERERRGV